MDTASDHIKEQVEKHLLDSMKGIDGAIFEICQYLTNENYGTEVAELSSCKRTIKSILNKHFDRLARKNSEAITSLNTFNNSLKKNFSS